jgi:hypothetical protein
MSSVHPQARKFDSPPQLRSPICANCGAQLEASELGGPIDLCTDCLADADSVNVTMGNASECG